LKAREEKKRNVTKRKKEKDKILVVRYLLFSQERGKKGGEGTATFPARRSSQREYSYHERRKGDRSLSLGKKKGSVVIK